MKTTSGLSERSFCQQGNELILSWQVRPHNRMQEKRNSPDRSFAARNRLQRSAVPDGCDVIKWVDPNAMSTCCCGHGNRSPRYFLRKSCRMLHAGG
ncbi:hypothetical protein BaRGS_00015027 [Batillaria attramentaria]|uniref:Uncharacterized protein n=1 Tax=Batillaria attramentaria TaxID=370345 RepID=A0ABD0L3A8_9CAEN